MCGVHIAGVCGNVGTRVGDSRNYVHNKRRGRDKDRLNGRGRKRGTETEKWEKEQIGAAGTLPIFVTFKVVTSGV
jgi:hypothetical protein